MPDQQQQQWNRPMMHGPGKSTFLKNLAILILFFSRVIFIYFYFKKATIYFNFFDVGDFLFTKKCRDFNLRPHFSHHTNGHYSGCRGFKCLVSHVVLPTILGGLSSLKPAAS
jgi:hypothetical protein